MPNLSEILDPTPYELGDPAVIVTNGARFIGKVTAFAGVVYEGMYPRIEVTSPHGSAIEAGRCHVRRPNEHELERLTEYEKQAVERTHIGELYGGRLTSLTPGVSSDTRPA
jgi:hypothetical protein